MGRIAESELAEAYEVLGEEAVNEVVAKEIGYLTSEPLDGVLDAVSNGYDVYLDYDYGKDDVEALLAAADEVMSDRRRPCGAAGPEATKDEIFLEFEDGLVDHLKVTAENDALQAAEAISDRLAGTDGLFANFDPPYVVKGPGLYENSYTEADHREAAEVIAACPFPWIVTYDNVPLVSEIYSEFDRYLIDVGYSAASSKVGRELLIAGPGVTVPDWVERA